MMESVSMATRKKISVVALFLACQKKILQIFLQNDINKNKELFEKLAKL